MKIKKQIKLAQKFLNDRRLRTDKVKGDNWIKIQCEVYSVGDVDMILILLKTGKFKKFIRQQERLLGKTFK